MPNNGNGVRIDNVANNTISGNVISGNGGQGIGIDGTGATGNLVEGNEIGTDVTGKIAVAQLRLGRPDPRRRQQQHGRRHDCNRRIIVSGNRVEGVAISANASNNLVEGNDIGTDASGVVALANGGDGVQIIRGPLRPIGGTSSSASNVISGYGGQGVTFFDAGTTGTLVEGNGIGTDATGQIAVGNNSSA